MGYGRVRWLLNWLFVCLLVPRSHSHPMEAPSFLSSQDDDAKYLPDIQRNSYLDERGMDTTALLDGPIVPSPDAMYDTLLSDGGTQAGEEEPANIYNLILTRKHHQGTHHSTLNYLSNKKVEDVFKKSSSGDSEDILKDIQNAVHLAITAVVGPDGQFQEALTQVMEEPGKDPVVKIINSTIPNVSELESTIRSLLGSGIIFKRNAVTNTTVGYIPRSEQSVIQSLLNQTIGLKVPAENQDKRTHIVNIFIINIIECGKNYRVSEITTIPLSSTVSPFIQITSPVTRSTNNNDSVVREDESSNVELLRVYHALKKLSRPFHASLRKDNQPLRHTHLFEVKNKHFPKEIPRSPVRNDETPNPYGLNLNKNTILNLLPSFVRATTIPPVVPLRNASVYNNLGFRPSVLGLLPNDIFQISHRKFPFLTNKSSDGLLQNNLMASLNVFLDKFTQRKLSNYPNDNLNETAHFTSENISSVHRNEEITPYLSNMRNSNSSFLEDAGLLFPSQSTRTPILQRNPLGNNHNAESLFENLFERLGDTTGKSNSSQKLVNPLQFSQVNGENSETDSTSLAKMALPGGIAFVTALFPFWAPYLLGKRKKRGAVAIVMNETPEDVALNLILDRIHGLQKNITHAHEGKITSTLMDSPLRLNQKELPHDVYSHVDNKILANFFASAISKLDTNRQTNSGDKIGNQIEQGGPGSTFILNDQDFMNKLHHLPPKRNNSG